MSRGFSCEQQAPLSFRRNKYILSRHLCPPRQETQNYHPCKPPRLSGYQREWRLPVEFWKLEKPHPCLTLFRDTMLCNHIRTWCGLSCTTEAKVWVDGLPTVGYPGGCATPRSQAHPRSSPECARESYVCVCLCVCVNSIYFGVAVTSRRCVIHLQASSLQQRPRNAACETFAPRNKQSYSSG